MTGTVTDGEGSVLSFPMPREGLFEPPRAYAQLRENQPVAPVRLWDGRTAWLVTGHAEIRQAEQLCPAMAIAVVRER